ncbi:hypothetical protein L596_015318 [Steinernema carpocapsae]|uniref:Saposin B-type domain-containing protein n=1 Tax=Steinernema carpocapsae TaxID=34508 RepID=A0A4U5NFH9_STECR|nr:hypothetical protein L596_015318 [Steinernema carpocapsae]
MKTFAVLVTIALLGLVSTSVAFKDPLGKLRKQVCDACVELVTKAEKAEGNLDDYLNTHVSKVCDHAVLLLFKQVCVVVLTDMSIDLEKSIKEQLPPKEACQNVKLC